MKSVLKKSTKEEVSEETVAPLEEKKEGYSLISLFSKEKKKDFAGKKLSSATLMAGGKELQIIYIADDESIKELFEQNYLTGIGGLIPNVEIK